MCREKTKLCFLLSHTRASQDEWIVYHESDKYIKLVKIQLTSLSYILIYTLYTFLRRDTL